MRLSTVRDIAVAMAAPSIPKGGIRKKLRMRFVMQLMMVARKIACVWL